MSAKFPSLYQINTRVWLRELSGSVSRPATLDEVSDADLDAFAQMGFDWLWLMGVWQTGEQGRRVSRSNPQWTDGYRKLLPDLADADIVGSPYAVQNYVAHREFGGPAALARFRGRLRERGIRLLLDLVPNHTALDHPWVAEHPEYYIAGTEGDLEREPGNYTRVDTKDGSRVLAYGRDPYFPGWPDTLQLNYRSSGLRTAMLRQLRHIADQCDGVRCDMAMLLLPDVIDRTWSGRSTPIDGPPCDRSFWKEAVPDIRSRHRDFVFMAEVYWDREFELQQQGFDYTYDKRLYDRLHSRQTGDVRGHLRADAEFQRRSVRFLENHDEPRAAGTFPPDVHRAAALITFLVPGLRFFHEGEFEGRRQHVSVHLCRRPAEPIDHDLRVFYLRLLAALKSPLLRDGEWRLLEAHPAWDGNGTCGNYLLFSWSKDRERQLVVVNFAPGSSQCRVTLPWPEIAGKMVTFKDKFSDAVYPRPGDELLGPGLYLDLPAWGHHLFEAAL
jgi:hypothetical protein